MAAAPATITRPAAVLARRAAAPRRGAALTVRAAASPNGGGPGGKDALADLRLRGRAFMARHDLLSAGVGALFVTTYCVGRGQDPATALSITAAATVAALVAEELFFAGRARE